MPPERRDGWRDGGPERAPEPRRDQREQRGDNRLERPREALPVPSPVPVPVPVVQVPAAPAQPAVNPVPMLRSAPGGVRPNTPPPAQAPTAIQSPRERRDDARADNGRREDRRGEQRTQDEPTLRQEPAERTRSPARNGVN
jgi:hypothetical protein